MDYEKWEIEAMDGFDALSPDAKVNTETTHTNVDPNGTGPLYLTDNIDVKAQIEQFEKRLETLLDINYTSITQEPNLDNEDYAQALKLMESATDEQAYLKAAEMFKSISGFKDADEMAKICVKMAEATQIDETYDSVNRNSGLNNNIESLETTNTESESSPGCRRGGEEVAVGKDIGTAFAGENHTEDHKSDCIVVATVENEHEKCNADDLVDISLTSSLNDQSKRIEQCHIEEADQCEAERLETARRTKRNRRIAAITISTICVIFIFVVILITVVIPNGRYNEAATPKETEKNVEAITISEDAGSYEDSNEQIAELDLYEKSITELESGDIDMVTMNIVSGDTLFLGTYEQDNNLSNGSEQIEWIVLDVNGDQAFLVSKYALNAKPFNTYEQTNSWGSCSLRDWLNEEFLYQAFSEAERVRIAETYLEAEYNPVYDTHGDDSCDKVFLLSASEVERYFPDDSDKVCLATEYAKSQGAYTRGTYKRFDPETEEYYGCWWWLRTPGEERKWAAGVYSYVRSNRAPGESTIDYSGCSVWLTEYSVRPAMWITLAP